MRAWSSSVLSLLVLLVCCGGDSDDAAPEGGTQPSSADGGPNADGGVDETSTDGGDPPYMPVYGKWGVPGTTFTLPVPAAKPWAIYVTNVVAMYPEVDWTNLDRLYIPAGEYKSITLQGLPDRRGKKPLVVTNLGGQVKIGGFGSTHLFSIGGGGNWILTGRYDPISKTGDAGFRGHAEGDFPGSRGRYGIFVDDAFATVGLSGIAVGAKATDFELEVIEVARAEFAGVVAKTDNDGTATMSNVKLHDMYIHDTGSEGIYFGSTQAQPQHTFEKLSIHDNRLLRTGTEALQVGQLGDGCEIHHNVIGPAAIRWRSAFADYQDGNVQYGQRHGSSSFHHNVVIGTGDLFVELFPQPVAGDAHGPNDTITFSDNYFADTSMSAVYTRADANSVSIRFERNELRGFTFDYDQVYPNATAPTYVFGVGANTTNPHVVKDNAIDGPYPFFTFKAAALTESNNVTKSIPRVVFRDFMGPTIDESYRKVEWWTDVATRAPNTPAVTYAKDAFVMHGGTLYRALAQSSGKVPSENPNLWQALPPPVDDVRLAKTSPHADYGVRFPAPD